LTRHGRLLEVAVVSVALAALAAAIYGHHAIHGGFIGDGWANVGIYELAPKHGLAGGIESFLAQPSISPRPLYAVYLTALNMVLGTHMGLWLAWLVATNVLMCASVYALLRELDFARLDAGLMATLLLIFPAASSLRLWTAVVQAPLAIALTAVGFLVALRAFDSRGGRRLALHGASLALFAASLLLYEIALPVMLASVLLYRFRVPWRVASTRWVADCGVLLPLALAVTRSSAAGTQQGDGMWDHAAAIFDQAQTLLATVVLPLGSDRWHVLALVAMVPLAAIAVRSRLPRDDPARATLRRWLTVVLAGLVVAGLGYAIYVPGIDYYSPMGLGIANRVNAVPGVGWVLVVYGIVRLAATMAFRGLASAPLLGAGLSLAACVLLGASWVQATARDADAYERAYLEGARVLSLVQAAVPDPPEHSAIWTFGQPVEIRPGIPVFGNTWDFPTSLQLRYGTPAIAGYVGFPGTTFDCQADRIVPGGNPNYQGANAELFAVGYGRTYFVDATTGRSQRIRTPAQCRKAAQAFPRSPPYPPPS
jgi:hypothetical protein